MKRREVLGIWWAWQWRVIVTVILANILIGFLIGLIGSILAWQHTTIAAVANLLSLGVTIYASIYFLGYALRLKRVYIPRGDLGLYQKAAIK